MQVSGIRCERCVARLAGVLTGHEGLEAANATLMGDVTLVWDDELTSRDELLGHEAPEPEALLQLGAARAGGIECVAADLVGRSVG